MELRQLEYMREAIHTKNFATAAQACHVSASSLGQQIRNLEKELGCDLFVREAGNLCPTDTGLEIARLADRVLDDIDRTKTALKSRGGGTPTAHWLLWQRLSPASRPHPCAHA